jgi:hypothetical protein
MRYYCKFCGSTIEPRSNIGREAKYFKNNSEKYCPLCGNNGVFVKISELETVEQWEKRTRKKWRDDRLVFLSYKDAAGNWLPWIVSSYAGVKAYIVAEGREYVAFCIPNSKRPPNDWRPE